MSSHEPHVEFVRVCGFPNELEASIILQMLNDEGVTTKMERPSSADFRLKKVIRSLCLIPRWKKLGNCSTSIPTFMSLIVQMKIERHRS